MPPAWAPAVASPAATAVSAAASAAAASSAAASAAAASAAEGGGGGCARPLALAAAWGWAAGSLGRRLGIWRRRRSVWAGAEALPHYLKA